MKELNCEQYIKNIVNYEKLYLLLTHKDKVYLFADIEEHENYIIGGLVYRIELLEFDLDTSLSFSEANAEGRERYFGDIYFIEYKSRKESEKKVLKDFFNLAKEIKNKEKINKEPTDKKIIYVLCEENELKDVLKSYPDNII